MAQTDAPSNRPESISLSLSSASEAIDRISSAILSTLPWAGGLGSLIGRYYSAKRQKRLEDFIARLRDDLARLEGRFDSASIDSEEFSDRFEQALQSVSTTPHREKHDMFRAIVVGAATGSSVDPVQAEYFMFLVNHLSVVHIRVLKFLHTPIEYARTVGLDPGELQGGFKSMFSRVFPQTSLDSIQSAFAELNRLGLIGTSETIFTTMTSGSGLALLQGRVSPLGSQFLNYCSSPFDKQ